LLEVWPAERVRAVPIVSQRETKTRVGDIRGNRKMSEVEVRHLWNQVPSVGCKGLCVESCGPILETDAEAAIHARKGIEIGFDRETLTCDQLRFGRCGIYDERPLVCRLWGAIPDMPCPFGCEPSLSSEQGQALMQAMFAVPGAAQ
jgi:hypothetical protein